LSDKIKLDVILNALDAKDYGFYDRLTPEQQKQLSPFLLNRYISIVKDGKPRHKSTQIETYYLMATNEQVNTQYFELAKHPKLIWQLLCTVSPGMGKQFHQWVGHKKKDKGNSNKVRKYIEQLHPTAKRDELDWLCTQYTEKDIKALDQLYGNDGKL
jgi:hypothetical protein